MKSHQCSALLLCLVAQFTLPAALTAAGPPARPLPPPEPPLRTWKSVSFNQIAQVALSPDGKRIAVYYPRPARLLVLYDRTTGKEIHHFDPKVTRSGSSALLFTPDSKRLITAHGRIRTPRINEAWIWDVVTGKLLRVIPFRQRQYQDPQPNQLVVTDQLLVVNSEDDVAGVYDLSTGKDLGVLAGHHRAASMALSRDGRWLFTSHDAETMCLWDVEKRKLLHKLRGNAKTLAFSPDAVWCASVSEKGELRVFDRATGKQKANTPSGLWRVYSRLQFSPDGKTLVAIGHGLNYGLRVWDWQACSRIWGADRLCKVVRVYPGSNKTIKPTEGAVREATVASDGTLLVWNYFGLEFWDLGLPKPPTPSAAKTAQSH